MIEITDIAQQKEWPDLAGHITGDQHNLPIRVYFEDTDFSGLVYHANYLKFIERGRSDFVRLLGVQHNQLLSPENGEDSAVFVVRSIKIDYLAPAGIDDLLVVSTMIRKVGAASVTLDQTVSRNDKILVRAIVEIVLISKKGKPLRLGEKIKKAFATINSNVL